MSMRLYTLPEIHQSSWIEMKPDVAMRYEVDRQNELATLYFGYREEYVVTLGRDNLNQLIDLGTAAREELAAQPLAEDQ